MIVLAAAAAVYGQSPPPIASVTSYANFQVDQVCLEDINGHETYVTNTVTFSTSCVNTNGRAWYYNTGVPFTSDMSWNCCEHCGDTNNLEEIFWLHYQFNPSGDTNIWHTASIYLGTTNLWDFKPIDILNAANTTGFGRHIHFHVDGPNTTLAFATKLDGTYSWSGSENYDLYPGTVSSPYFVRAQNFNTLAWSNMFATNIVTSNGVVIEQTPIHLP